MTDLHSDSFRCNLLNDFMLEFDLVSVDLHTSIIHTYERDDGLVTSWPDHFLASSLACNISSVKTLQSGSILSDHFPLYAELNLHIQFLSSRKTTLTNTINKVNWDYVTNSLLNFRQYIVTNLPSIASDILLCCDVSCTVHLSQIDQLAISLLQCISEASSLFLPTVRPSQRHCIPGWNDHVCEFKLKADFWYRVWTEAGSPESGVLFQIKKHVKSRYKYEIRELKRREEYIKNQKLSSTFSKSSTKQFWKEVKRIRNSGNIASAASVIDGVSVPRS